MTGLLAGAAVLLVAATLIPLAFEDSYQHWLIAANLARDGRLADPLFGMEDTWLPAFQLLAAAVLRVFGWRQLGVLRLLDVAIGLGTLALVHRLAGGGRRGAIALVLLALNPVFLLTATSVVAEPLLVLLLLGTSASALARRYPLAALLAVSAALTGTKAWLWLLALVAVNLLLPRFQRAGARPAMAWAVPAVAVLLLLQLGFSTASHSVARAAEEVSSAGARGSLPISPFARGLEFLQTFALASLPLVVLAPLGVLAEWRAGALGRMRLLHLPALLYLSGVVALVFVGAYSGSHRYLYPVLPALAILAAFSLDRVPAPAALAAVGASGLLAIGFVPVLQGLGALDSGLARAGTATRSHPGAIVTDSPVAAYFSGRSPGQVFGSRALPADPAVALGWLRARGVSTLVLEDVSYYRAETALPGLAQGVARAPFLPLGEQSSFQAPGGGKKVAVYWLATGPLAAPLVGRTLADLSPADQPRAGKTAPLEKGLTLVTGSTSLAGEGMGFGVPLVRYPDGDYFSGTAATVDGSPPGAAVWTRIYQLDRLGVDSDRAFAVAPSRGTISVTYRVQAGIVDIVVAPPSLQPGFQQVVLLNEESSGFDDFADPTHTWIGEQVGPWRPVTGDWGRFRSSALGIEWSLSRPAEAEGMYAARELRSPDIDFSGVEYVFGPDFAGTRYRVTVGRAR